MKKAIELLLAAARNQQHLDDGLCVLIDELDSDGILGETGAADLRNMVQAELWRVPGDYGEAPRFSYLTSVWCHLGAYGLADWHKYDENYSEDRTKARIRWLEAKLAERS